MVAKARTSRRAIAELAFVLRALLDDFEADGVRRIAGHRAALDLADAFARGAAAPALDDVRAAIAAERARYGKSSAPLYAQFCALPVDALLLMVERGDDESTHVLTYARQCVPRADWATGTRRVDALLAEAKAHAASIDDAPLGAKKPTPGPQVALVGGLAAERDQTRTVDRATLAARLTELDYPVSEPILAFEAHYGGLLLPLSHLDHWREDGAYTLVGPWAFLNTLPARAHLPRGGDTPLRLVPVAMGRQDDLYFLDEAGAPYWHETIGEPAARPFGADGAELVHRLALGALTYASIDREGTAVFPAPARVAEVAPALGLERLFVDANSEWWSGPAAVVVVFRGQSWGLARTAAAAKLLSA